MTQEERLQKLVALCRELLEETDGMTTSRSVAALLNGIEDLIQRMDSEDDE